MLCNRAGQMSYQRFLVYSLSKRNYPSHCSTPWSLDNWSWMNVRGEEEHPQFWCDLIQRSTEHLNTANVYHFTKCFAEQINSRVTEAVAVWLKTSNGKVMQNTEPWLLCGSFTFPPSSRILLELWHASYTIHTRSLTHWYFRCEHFSDADHWFNKDSY